MIDELFVYGRKDSLFKSICAQIDDIQMYHVSPNYGYDLNTNNLQTFIKDPISGLQDVNQKYPICVCVTPLSSPTMLNGYRWERFFFSLFFLERTGYINGNQVRNIDEDTQLSQDENEDNWSRMKTDSMNFLDLLDQTLKGDVTIVGIGTVPFKRIINLDFSKVNVRRLSNYGVDKISGIELSFSLFLSTAQCETIEIDDITYLVDTFFQDSYEKILGSGTSVVVNSSEHKLNRVRGITLLDPLFNEVDIEDSIDGLTVSINSNVDLNNHKLIIF